MLGAAPLRPLSNKHVWVCRPTGHDHKSTTSSELRESAFATKCNALSRRVVSRSQHHRLLFFRTRVSLRVPPSSVLEPAAGARPPPRRMTRRQPQPAAPGVPVQLPTRRQNPRIGTCDPTTILQMGGLRVVVATDQRGERREETQKHTLQLQQTQRPPVRRLRTGTRGVLQPSILLLFCVSMRICRGRGNLQYTVTDPGACRGLFFLSSRAPPHARARENKKCSQRFP